MCLSHLLAFQMEVKENEIYPSILVIFKKPFYQQSCCLFPKRSNVLSCLGIKQYCVCSMFCGTTFLAFVLRYVITSFQIDPLVQSGSTKLLSSLLLNVKFYIPVGPSDFDLSIFLTSPLFLSSCSQFSVPKVCFINNNGILEYNSPQRYIMTGGLEFHISFNLKLT